MQNPQFPAAHHVAVQSTPLGSPMVLLAVTQPEQLAPALAQREKAVVIDNKELERKFSPIEFWQGREGTYRYLATLMAMLFALALALQYSINITWLRDWKLDRLEGKITLTPTKKAE